MCTANIIVRKKNDSSHLHTHTYIHIHTDKSNWISNSRLNRVTQNIIKLVLIKTEVPIF